MQLDPKTQLRALLIAIPSSALVFSKLGIPTQGNEGRTLEDLCAEFGVSFESFLKGMEEVDWSDEAPPSELLNAS